MADWFDGGGFDLGGGFDMPWYSDMNFDLAPNLDSMFLQSPALDFPMFDSAFPDFPALDFSQFDLGANLDLPTLPDWTNLALGASDFSLPTLGTPEIGSSIDLGADPTFSLGGAMGGGGMEDLGFGSLPGWATAGAGGGFGAGPTGPLDFRSQLPFDTGQQSAQFPNYTNLGSQGGQSPLQVREMIQAALGGGRGGGILGTGMTGSDIASLGQVGLGAAGLISKLLAGDPEPRKPSALEQARMQAEIDRINAETERVRNPIFPPRSGGGGGGGASGPPAGYYDALIRKADAETAKLNQRPAGQQGVAEFLAASGLGGGQPGQGGGLAFNTLLESILKERGGIAAPTEEGVQGRADALVMQQTAEIDRRYAKQAEAVMERANREGFNPSGLLAELEAQKQAELGQLRVGGRKQALTEMQSQQGMALERLKPMIEAAQLMDPARYAGVLAQIFGMDRDPMAGVGGLTRSLAGDTQRFDL